MADVKATGPVGNVLEVEEITLTAAQIAAKEVQLSQTPIASKVVVDIPCGTVQISGLDYIVSGDMINWDGRGMETILSEGNFLIVTYAVDV